MFKNLTEILNKAGSLASSMQKSNTERISKGGLDYATEADLKVQELIVRELRNQFPGITILGEEGPSHNLDLNESFIIDPIDGTFDYSYGGEEWGVIISYFKNGSVEYSGVLQPKLNNMLLSGRKEGSFLNEAKLVPKEVPDRIEESILIQCLGNWLSKSYYQEVLLPTVKKARIVRSFSSIVQVSMQLAKGNGHCFIGEGGKVWDYAPVSLLIENLIGIGSDFNGHKLVWRPEAMKVIFSLNEDLHQKILDCIIPS